MDGTRLPWIPTTLDTRTNRLSLLIQRSACGEASPLWDCIGISSTPVSSPHCTCPVYSTAEMIGMHDRDKWHTKDLRQFLNPHPTQRLAQSNTREGKHAGRQLMRTAGEPPPKSSTTPGRQGWCVSSSSMQSCPAVPIVGPGSETAINSWTKKPVLQVMCARWQLAAAACSPTSRGYPTTAGLRLRLRLRLRLKTQTQKLQSSESASS